MVSISPRPTLSVGWEVRPSFSVSQNRDRGEVLLLIQEYFQCGSIRPDRSDKTVKWEVRSLPQIVERVIPHFEMYPLLSGKRADFESFKRICERMARGEHLLASRLAAIVDLTRSMNPSGKRGYRADTIIENLSEMKA